MNTFSKRTWILTLPPPFTCIDQREITAGVFLDLSKAFDTLDHEIMFAKLEHGVRGVVLQWIKT